MLVSQSNSTWLAIRFEFNWQKAFDKNVNIKRRIVRIKVFNTLGNFVVMWIINNHIDHKTKTNDIDKFKSNSRKYSIVMESRKNQKRI
jgi:fucose permease